MVKGMEEDLKSFACKELPYDYGTFAADFILENKKEIFKYVKTLLNLSNELDEKGELIEN